MEGEPSTDINNQQQLDQLHRELLSGNMEALRPYYLSYKSDFFKFASRYSRDEIIQTDAYHDAFVSLYENIISGSLTEMTSTLKTYVFSIAKYNLFNELRRQGKTLTAIEDVSVPAYMMQPVDEPEDERAIQLRRSIARLGDSCREILTLFYYRRYSIEAIMHTMQYKNENTVKAHKSRCLQKLRELMHTPQKLANK